MRPTLKQLQYLIAIAETGSFRNAALQMNVSQPSLSSQIQTMEFELDVQLVERMPKGAVMTPNGEQVAIAARDILRRVEKLKDDVHRKPHTLSGRVRLGVTPTVGPYLLPLVIDRLHDAFPDVRLNIHDKKTIELDVMLKAGQLDVLISTLADHSNTRSIPLFDEALWIAVAPDHPLASERSVFNIHELEGYELLSIGEGNQINMAIHHLAELAGAFVSSEYQGSGLDATRIMAATGSGVAILPSVYAMQEAGRDRTVCIRKIEDPRTIRTISLIWRETSPLASDFATLAVVIKEVAQQLLKDS